MCWILTKRQKYQNLFEYFLSYIQSSFILVEDWLVRCQSVTSHLMSNTYNVWMMRFSSGRYGSDPRPLWLQSAWAPTQRQDPKHSVKLLSLPQLASPAPVTRCDCQSMLGLTEPTIRRVGRLQATGTMFGQCESGMADHNFYKKKSQITSWGRFLQFHIHYILSSIFFDDKRWKQHFHDFFFIFIVSEI